ncbi:helix-turn-helix domain-containing protein [Francisella hispaniensis]|uniref:HTH cro/C1-type domain-containing protein n=1 Tax=Francisella hispaniensis TaxID=622488 RepID=F4BFT7_9GAMM|nr:helix-turn-helix domain-containing protein [Francisella hispaniensis]AEE26331.1 hypothetical protein FN3523_1028 [Francisella hispaniensis]
MNMSHIKIELRKKGITQKELAEKLGITTNAIQKWFKGETSPTMNRYLQILDILGITTGEAEMYKLGRTSTGNIIHSQRTVDGDITNLAVSNNKGIVGSNNSNIAFGKNSNVSINSDAPSNDGSLASIPVIKREDILDFKNAKRIDSVAMKLPADKHNKCFAFEYTGTDMRYDTNSMLPAYSYYSIDDGSKIFVDISKDAINSLTSGDLVVCIADNKVNVRVLYNDGYDTTLMPLNSIAQNKDQNKELSKNKIVGRVFLIRFDRSV